MWKRILRAFLVCTVVVSCLCASAQAVEQSIAIDEMQSAVIMRASGSFSVTIPAHGEIQGNKTFSLESGETVRINASYSPNASMDFGLIDSDGVFHYVNVTNGSIDTTIQVSESGNYMLGIKNNSAKTVKVSGFVKY